MRISSSHVHGSIGEIDGGVLVIRPMADRNRIRSLLQFPDIGIY